jgi:hypothetical protein
VQIFLTEEDTLKEYEIHLGVISGSKQISYIVNSAGERIKEVDTLNMLSSGQLTKFWLAWTHREELYVGMGMVPREGITIFAGVPMDINIHTISFTSPKNNGFWSVPRLEGEIRVLLRITRLCVN